MSVAWHIVKKDFIRLKWILVLWAVVLAGNLGLAVIQSGLNPETYFPFWIAASIITRGFLPLLSFGLVMGLLHDDPVAETDAFWITRPISGGEILAAKALALLLLALVPVVVTLPFWLAYDYTLGQVSRAALQTLQAQGLIAVAALPFAVLSANASKFVMHVMAAAGGLLLLSLLGQLGSNRNAPPLAPGLVLARSWVIVGLWLAATLLMTANQFWRRRTRQSVVVAAVAVALGFAVVKWWPWAMGLAHEPAAESSQTLTHGAPSLKVKVDGESRQTSIVGQVPLREGAHASRRGLTLKIQNVFVDYTGELQVAFSESIPQLGQSLGDRLPGAKERSSAPAYYFLLNPDDHRLLAIQPGLAGNGLRVGTLAFSHATIRTRVGGVWQGGMPPDFQAWLRGAWLIKVLGPEPERVAAISPR